jgi:hypothetical protein
MIGFMKAKPVLKPVRDPDYPNDGECSFCGQRFRPDPNDPGKLSREWGKHQDSHSSAKEDFSQAAARIVREATENS